MMSQMDRFSNPWDDGDMMDEEGYGRHHMMNTRGRGGMMNTRGRGMMRPNMGMDMDFRGGGFNDHMMGGGGMMGRGGFSRGGFNKGGGNAGGGGHGGGRRTGWGEAAASVRRHPPLVVGGHPLAVTVRVASWSAERGTADLLWGYNHYYSNR